MKGKVLSVLIISGIILIVGGVNTWGKEDRFKIIENDIEAQPEFKMEKIKGQKIIGNFQEDGFIVQEEVSFKEEEPLKEILIKGLKNHDDQSIDVSGLNIKSIWNMKESNGCLYFTAKKNNTSRKDTAYEINIKNKEIRDLSSYIEENEVFYQDDEEKNFILVNRRAGKIRSLNKHFKEMQNFQLPIKKGEKDMYYENNIRAIKAEGMNITKVYFEREQIKKDGYMGLDEILSKQTYVYDANLGIERILPFKETILSFVAERRGRIFIEEKVDDNVYLTQKDERGRTLNKEFLYNMKKGYLRREVDISPNGEFAVMNFIRTFEKDNKEEVDRIQELYLIDMKNHKKIKLMAFEEGEGNINGTIWSKNSKKLGINSRDIARQGQYCILKIDEII